MDNKHFIDDDELELVSGGIDYSNAHGDHSEYRVGYTTSRYYNYTIPQSQKATMVSIIQNLKNSGAFLNKTQDEADDIIFAALNAPGSGVTLTAIDPIAK